MKFDTFLATVNDWGKFQKVKYTLICLTYMLPSMMVYTYSFTGAKPNFRCANPAAGKSDLYSASANEQFKLLYQPTAEQCKAQQNGIELAECQRCFLRSKSPRNQTSSNDPLQKCDAYVYDREHYERTLVVEVRILRQGATKRDHWILVGYDL